jgi:hypothetical protein
MTKLLRAGLVALLGFAVATPAALAGKVPAATPEKGHMTVRDDAHVFDKDSVIQAEEKFHGLTFKSPTHLTVVTVDKVPADRKADYEKMKGEKTSKRQFMKEWAREMSQAESARGVFVLVCTESRSIEVLADRQTDLYRHFNDSDADKVYTTLSAAFKSAEEAKTDDEKRAVRGEGLVKGTDYVIGRLKNTSAPEATGTTHSDGTHEPKKAGMPWWGWVLIVLGVLLFIWVIVAVIRAMTGNVYGGMYGGYGGYGYGGGGPGFFGMFMGGMLGSMAGMWLYNSMFGGHMYYDSGMAAAGTYPEGGYDPSGGDTGAGDYDGGAEAGGDWGGDDGGAADAGGGGGDWGNDGGGDWGGDGGGGDWGGDGGGGDFGGGGGDW